MHENIRFKEPVPIIVTCTNGNEFQGNVYIEPTQRLSDLMNDHRAFLPVQQDHGGTVVIAKTSILWVNETIPSANEN